MKKILALLLVFALTSSLLIGCGTKEEAVTETKTATETTAKTETATKADDVEVVEETVAPLVSAPVEMKFVFAGGDPQSKQLMSEGIDAFNAMYEDITIIEIPSSSGGYLDFVKTQDAIGEFPDILESRDTQLWVEAGKLAELSSNVLDRIDNPPAFEGKYYVSPISMQLPSIGVYYNKKMFAELGLEEPTTQAEFDDVCNALLAAGIAPIVQGGKDVWHMGFWWSNFWNEEVFADNPEWLADKRAGTVSFTDDNVQAMLNKYASNYENGYVEKGWLSTADNQITTYMAAEKAAMFFSGSWMINQMAEADPEFELGWFPMPDENGDTHLIYGPSLAGFALSAEAAKDPDKVIAFELFMDSWYAPEHYADYCSQVVFAPATKDKMDVQYDTDFPIEFSKALSETASTSVMWNGLWGDSALPGGFRNFAYKAFQEKVANGSSTMELGELLDKQWDVEIAQTE